MKFKKQIKKSAAIKILAEEKGKIIGHAYLYLIYNDLHKTPYGLLEDVFVEEGGRGKGMGSKLVKAVIAEAKKHKCYKLVANSRCQRKQIHDWYEKMGLREYGLEFRMDLEKKDETNIC